MATTAEYNIGEFTFPRGWFMVAESAEATNKPYLLYTSPSPRDRQKSRMPSSA